MSDRQLAEMLDRAVNHAPQMHVTGDDMLAAGKGRVRRRRAVGIGAALGTAALVAAVWSGLAGGDGTLLGTTEIQPATSVWEEGETVDAALFTGLQTIDQDQVAHAYDARLGRVTSDGPVTLTLSDGGEVVEEVPAQSPVPGLEVFAGERMTVAVWAEPEGVVASVPLVGPLDPGGPATVQRTQVADEELAYAVWAGDVVPLPQAVRDVYLVGQDEVVSLSGTAVGSEVLRAGGVRALAWSDRERGVWGYAVDGQDSPFLEQLGHWPAQPASFAFSEDGRGGAVTVLPEGAELDRMGLADGEEVNSAALDGREVVLTAAEGDVVPDVTFTLDDATYPLDAYLADLVALDTVGGGQLTVVPDEDGAGGLTLQDRTGTVPVELTPEELGDGVVSRAVHGSTVVVASGWDPGPAVLTASRVELVGADGLPGWAVPSDVAQVALPDGTLLTLMTVDAADGVEVAGAGHQVGGEIERWTPPVTTVGGVEMRLLDGEPVPHLDGGPLERLDDGSLGGVRHYAGASWSGADYLVVPGTGAGEAFVPLVGESDGQVRPAPEAVLDQDVVELGGQPLTVLRVSVSLAQQGRSVVLGGAVQRGSGDAANSWALAGSAASAHVVIDPGAVVTVAADQGVWLLYPQGSTDPEELQAGRTDDDVLRLTAGQDAAELTLVAVHPAGAPGPRVGDVEGELTPTGTHDVADLDLVVRTWRTDVGGD